MDIEKQWWNVFGDSYGVEFEKACPDYNSLDRETQLAGALMKLELDMYNGGFIQFFCNWGYPAYLLAVDGLEQIGAQKTKTAGESLCHFRESRERQQNQGAFGYSDSIVR